MAAFFLVDLSYITQFVVPTCSLEEFAAVVADARLAKFELQLSLSVVRRVDEQSGAVVVSFCLNRIFFLEK